MQSVLGSRSCVGMVGGTIYVRGPVKELSDCVCMNPLNDEDIQFLSCGMFEFLKDIKKDALYSELTKWSDWKKILPISSTQKKKVISVSDFRKNYWINEGIFGDFIKDDFIVYDLPALADGRVHIPKWDKTNCVDCKICLNNCPQFAINVQEKIYTSDENKCIGCGICSAVCPKNCWEIITNRKEIS